MYDDDIMIVEVELNAFESILQSGEDPNERPTISMPTTYRGDSDRTNLFRNSEMNVASQVTGKTLCDVWGLDNYCDLPPQPLVRPYKKVDISKGAILEALETICDVFDAMKHTQNTQKVRKTGFSVEISYNTIRLLAVCGHLRLLLEGRLKGEATTWSSKYYIRPLNNKSVEWFSRKIGNWGYYYIQNKELIFSLQGKHTKVSSLIENKDIVMECMS